MKKTLLGSVINIRTNPKLLVGELVGKGIQLHNMTQLKKCA